jgi:hypothetical protein
MFIPLHPQIIITVTNGNENALLHFTISHLHDHNYNSLSCDSKILVHHTIQNHFTKREENGTKL